MKRPIIILIFTTCIACNGLKSIKNVITNTPPYEQYLKSLKNANLEKTPMANKWIAAGQNAFQDSLFIGLPFEEKGFFDEGEPAARSYKFEVKEGQKLIVNCQAKSEGRTFIDLFAMEKGEWEQLAHADSTMIIAYEFKDDSHCLLRLQPELLTNAYYNLRIILSPALVNPVSGASNSSIGSFFGAARDAGKRRHEGLDIFARKGTPVIAPTNGYISRVGTNNLGGKVIWMRDNKRGQSYYFAHLDSQIVRSGKAVKPGDTLGLVGNTGNARHTPSHLHFGIYQHGAKDPINYVRTFKKMNEGASLDTAVLHRIFKIGVKKSNLRSGPGTNYEIIDQLEQDTYIKIIGQVQEWYRVVLPDQTQGYLFKTLLSGLGNGYSEVLSGTSTLLSAADVNAIPISQLKDSTSLRILAKYQKFNYVKTIGGTSGWIEM